MNEHLREVKEGARFEFGANWARFISVLTDQRIAEAEKSLQTMLGVEHLRGKTFLDIGSGSGLFSLAARRLGAKVHSFDYDPQSVACTAKLKDVYFPADRDWHVEEGSALDVNYLAQLGQFDVVYSWGVLHHTGAMWLGIENALQRVAVGGHLFIALYNDQGAKSRVWWFIKYGYNQLPRPLNTLYAYAVGAVARVVTFLKDTLSVRPKAVVRPLLPPKQRRGMSTTHDLIDWVGGFPYEFVRYDVLNAYLKARRFELAKGKEATSLGCHETVYARVSVSGS